MNRITKYLTVFAFSLLILGLPTFASAQWRDRDRDDDYYRTQRDRNNRNDRYNNRGALRSAIERLKNDSRELQRQIDRELDRSRYDGRRREDRLNDLAKDFRNAAARLDDEFDGGRDYNDSYDEARQVLNLGRQVENAISRARLGYTIQNTWNRVRQDLNIISSSYGNGRGNRNNRGGRNNFPFPF